MTKVSTPERCWIEFKIKYFYRNAFSSLYIVFMVVGDVQSWKVDIYLSENNYTNSLWLVIYTLRGHKNIDGE